MTPLEGFEIRAGRNADGPALEAIVSQILREYGLCPEPDGEDQDLRRIETFYAEPRGWFRVMVEKTSGEIIGSVGLRAIGSQTIELRKMYLKKEFRGHGLGRALLEEALRECRRRKIETVRLETATVLTDAIGLYRKYGFVEAPNAPHVCRCDLVMELRPG